MNIRRMVLVVAFLAVLSGLSVTRAQASSNGWWVEVVSSSLAIRQCPSVTCPIVDPGVRSRNVGGGTAMVTTIQKGGRVKVTEVVGPHDPKGCVDDGYCLWYRVGKNAYIYAGYVLTVPDPPKIVYTCPNDGRCIVVDRKLQRLYALEGSEVLLATYPSTGGWNPTPTGTFSVLDKTEMKKMVGSPSTTGKRYVLHEVMWQVRFFELYKIHAAYWHNQFGLKVMSSGCVNLDERDARFVYDFVQIGTPVIVGDDFEYAPAG